MATKQRILFGGTFERSTNGTTWTPVLEVKSFDLPVISTEYQDATSLDSTGGFREYVKGLKDVEDITVNCGYVSATYEQALADSALTVPIYYRGTLPKETGQTANGDRFTFTAFPTPRAVTNDIGGIIMLEISMKVTGGFTFVKGA